MERIVGGKRGHGKDERGEVRGVEGRGRGECCARIYSTDPQTQNVKLQPTEKMLRD